MTSGGYVVGVVATGAMLRVVAGRRARQLRSLREARGADWMALCTVMDGGGVLDRVRRRVYVGQQGVLVVWDGVLRYWLRTRRKSPRGTTRCAVRWGRCS
jgi:hypothetical protein